MNAKYDTFHVLLDEAIQGETRYEGMSINNKTIFLQTVIRNAGMKAFGSGEKDVRKHVNVKTTPYMRKLKVKRKFLERATKRLASAKATKKAAGIPWTLEEEESLANKLQTLQIISEKYCGESLEGEIKERSKLRTKIILKTKNFWKLINKVMSQMTGISAVEDNEGNLVTSNALIQEVVLVEMAKIYKGQRSEIFDSRGEQQVKAAYTLHHEDQGEWIKREHDSKLFEEEVCAGVTVKQVTDTVKSHKDNRAPGIVNVPTKLYKNATPLYYWSQG